MVPVVLGLALWAVAALRPRSELGSTGDRVLDPRTGADMAPDVPWWARFVVVGAPLTMLVVVLVLGLASR